MVAQESLARGLQVCIKSMVGCSGEYKTIGLRQRLQCWRQYKAGGMGGTAWHEWSLGGAAEGAREAREKSRLRWVTLVQG